MRVKSGERGKRTSAVRVTSISPEGFRLRMQRKTRLVSFDDFPWFRDATIAQLTNVTLPSAHHLYWPDLDIDIAVESLDHPDRYPLVSRIRRGSRSLVTERRSEYRTKCPKRSR